MPELLNLFELLLDVLPLSLSFAAPDDDDDVDDENWFERLPPPPLLDEMPDCAW